VFGASGCFGVAAVWSQHVAEALYVDSSVPHSGNAHRLPARSLCTACLPVCGTPYWTVLLFDLFIVILPCSDRGCG
jgi:hypothetical protein